MKISNHSYRACFALCFTVLFVLLSACSVFPGSPGGATPTQKPASPTAAPAFVCASHSSNPVTLTMYYGSEKQEWMNDVISVFNSQKHTACDGPITVKGIAVGSGESMQQIVNGTIRPDIWSPAGSVWLTLINDLWQQKNGTKLVGTGANDTPSLVLSPVVIAMWKSQAQALGWPNRSIGWSDIYKLSTDPKGWADPAYGHPEWGQFKFGHTNPDNSNSGLDAVIAENYAGVGKLRGLTIDDVNNPTTTDFVSNVESSIIAYGESTGFFAGKMFCNGENYLSAAVMYESLVVEGNQGKIQDTSGQQCNHLADQIVAIYPKEGTFYSDHPFVIPQASWVTPAKMTSALLFRSFLLDPAQQQKAIQYGFRPAISGLTASSPLDSAHGVDLNQPRTLLQVPPADVVKALKTSWEDQRRKVDVMLILDRSGSMNDPVGGISKIEAAKQGLTEFVNLLGNSDGLGLTVFSDSADILTQVTSIGSKRQNVLNQINGITASGNTRLFNTIEEQWKTLTALPSKHIKAIVVLTDGMDNANLLTINQLVSDITPSGPDRGNGIKVYTIAYGNDADVGGLTRVANATGAQEYVGNPQNIKQVYLDISEFF